ncbi:energy transducer TonB [Paracoccus sp. p4-l81]|uniref:energy transducer TonB n=1 Tax=Paracoccus sp. p4-l81 TaxID=3342806 RepID=UPI0035B74BB6
MIGAAARWLTGLALVLAAHLGVAHWLMATAISGPPASVAAPVFVELVAPEPEPQPEPEAEPAPEPEALPVDPGIPPQILEVPDVQPAPPEPEPEPEREPEPEPEPEPQPEPEPEPELELPPLTPLPPPTDLAEQLVPPSPRPQSRPPRPKPVEPAPRRQAEKPRPTRAEPAPAKPATAKPAAPRATAPAAPRRDDGARAQAAAASAGAVRNWQSEAGARIARHMKRTRISGRGASVQVQLAIQVGANGAASARLASSTGDPRIDAALARQAGRLPRLPAPPGGQGHSFVLPILIQF